MARNTTSLVQLAGLSFLLRILMEELSWPFILVSPTSLKKYTTGKGNSDKNLMMMSTYKDYGFESMDDNICDSYMLSIVGLALLGKPLKKMIKSQEEVIKLLKKQL
jgi:crossover junction endodeoxyribonuclease RuvC